MLFFGKMLISMQSIRDWAAENPAERKFVKGKKILEAGNIVKCGNNIEKFTSDVSFTAVCLQTSQLTRSVLPCLYLDANFDDIVKVLKDDKKIPNLVYYCFRGRFSRIQPQFFFKSCVFSICCYKVKKKHETFEIFFPAPCCISKSFTFLA